MNQIPLVSSTPHPGFEGYTTKAISFIKFAVVLPDGQYWNPSGSRDVMRRIETEGALRRRMASLLYGSMTVTRDTVNSLADDYQALDREIGAAYQQNLLGLYAFYSWNPHAKSLVEMKLQVAEKQLSLRPETSKRKMMDDALVSHLKQVYHGPGYTGRTPLTDEVAMDPDTVLRYCDCYPFFESTFRNAIYFALDPKHSHVRDVGIVELWREHDAYYRNPNSPPRTTRYPVIIGRIAAYHAIVTFEVEELLAYRHTPDINSALLASALCQACVLMPKILPSSTYSTTLDDVQVALCAAGLTIVRLLTQVFEVGNPVREIVNQHDIAFLVGPGEVFAVRQALEKFGVYYDHGVARSREIWQS
ncbi:hypothetical protein PLICRDRAFT_415952 [Plicaturopsis crispa FD-325 SS-3]|nr:hypothetical protein PLICRDRAFT_415952 [Plicaturopsis crispa FD-325 SS-3]